MGLSHYLQVHYICFTTWIPYSIIFLFKIESRQTWAQVCSVQSQWRKQQPPPTSSFIIESSIWICMILMRRQPRRKRPQETSRRMYTINFSFSFNQFECLRWLSLNFKFNFKCNIKFIISLIFKLSLSAKCCRWIWSKRKPHPVRVLVLYPLVATYRG